MSRFSVLAYDKITLIATSQKFYQRLGVRRLTESHPEAQDIENTPEVRQRRSQGCYRK